MTQVTGNNITKSIAKDSILSIQLALDGLCFSVAQGGKVLHVQDVAFVAERSLLENMQEAIQAEPLLKYNYKACQVIFDVDTVCLVPEPLFVKSDTKAYFRANGIRKTSAEKSVVTAALGGVVALVAFPKPVFHLLRKHFDDFVSLHPLLLNVAKKHLRPTLEFNLSKSHVHVTLRNGELLYAQTLPYTGEADLLQYLGRFKERYNLSAADLLVSGYASEVVQKKLSKYYKPVLTDRRITALCKGDYKEISRYGNLIHSILCV